MRSQNMTRQVIAFLAAMVIVFTGIYVAILWRNQSPDRVFSLGKEHILYQTSDFAIGTSNTSGKGTGTVTLLRYAPEGGWVSAGTGNWVSDSNANRFARILVIPDESDGPAGGMWFSALQRNTRLTALQIINPGHPNQTQTFSFHGGGIIEPALMNPSSIIRGLSHQTVLFSIHWSGSN